MIITEEFKLNYERFITKHSLEECSILSNEIELEESKIARALDISISAAQLLEDANPLDQELSNTITGIITKMQQNSSVRELPDDSFKKSLLGIQKDDYEPIYVNKRVDASDLAPVARVKFLLERIIDWLKRVVIYAIDRIRTIFYTIVGRKDDASKMLSKLKDADLKFRASKISKIDTGFIKSIGGKENSPVRVLEIDTKTITQNPTIFKALAESVELTESEQDPRKQENDSNKDTKYDDNKDSKSVYRNKYNAIQYEKPGYERPVQRVLELDVSSDLYALQQTLSHFFDLFDRSFGSVGENLFDTADLTIVYNYIDHLCKSFEKGNVNPVILQNQLTNIDSDTIYENLIRTKTNVDNLEKAYYTTYQQIDKINKIITSKQLASLAAYGVNYMFLSQYTCNAMGDMLKYIDDRLKDATKMQKELDATRNKFNELCTRTEKLRNSIKGFNYIQVNTIYEQKINDLYLSTKYITQITTLRLNTLTKYIQELQQVRLTIANLNGLGSAQRANLQFQASI